jgi:hypothetical protein
VLFAADKGHVIEWTLDGDLRDVDLAALEPKGGAIKNVHVVSGMSAFVVDRATGKGEAVRLELWDADKVTKLRDLEGEFEPSQTFAFSRDRSRMMAGQCVSRPDKPNALQCEGAVYQLPSGDLVHRTTFTSMEVQGYVPTMALSPNGRFLSAESQLAPSELRDAVTGNLVLTVIDHSWGSLDESGVKLLWLDESHMLHTARSGSALTVDNVVPRPEPKQPPITLKVGRTKEESAGEPRVSPDKRRVATAARLDGGTELFVWDTITNDSHRHPVPRDVCIDDCDVDFADTDQVIVFSRTAPKTNLRVNAITKEEKVEPYRPAPTYVSGGFSVLSTLRASSVSFIAYARARDNAPPTSIVVVTPSGARVDLGVSVTAASIAVQGDHILVSTLKSTDVVSASGEWVRFVND